MFKKWWLSLKKFLNLFLHFFLYQIIVTNANKVAKRRYNVIYICHLQCHLWWGVAM